MKKVITKQTFLLVLAFAFISSTIAQRTITGTITDSETEEPLIGGNVLVVGFNVGTITDIDGKYSIHLPAGATTLEFSYAGYLNHTVQIGDGRIINVAFSTGKAAAIVDVITGYGHSSLMNYIERTKKQIKTFYDEGKLTELKEYLDESFNDCNLYSDMESCYSNLSFSGGYYFQQASKDQENVKGNDYIELAENYYKQVLLFLPENKAAQHNLSNLLQLKGLNESSVDWYQSMAEKYPNKKANYLSKLSELYSNREGGSAEAWNYLWEAYSADPYSRDIYEKIIDLYKKEFLFFKDRISLTNFAHRCQEFGFPNYGEELLRQKAKYSFSIKNRIDSEESIIAWINILVDNNWITVEKLESFIENNLKETRSRNVLQDKARIILNELSIFVQNKAVGNLNYWDKTEPKISINEEGDIVKPIDITIKILYQKGEKALFSNDPYSAEKFWNEALRMCKKGNNSLYPKIANDLAKLYYTEKTIDRGGRKLNKLVENLFDAKGSAYRNGDKDLIRECHTTLGEIYFNLKKWSGGWATNARFQLERALREDNGAVTNPELRNMLAVTYENTEEYDRAQESYFKATIDLLKIDQIEDAKGMLKKAKNLNNRVQSRDLKTKSKLLNNLISFREGKNDLVNRNIVNSVAAKAYIDKVDLFQQELNKVLDPKFVSGQLFKGLADLGEKISESETEVKQIIFSSALSKISLSDKLESITDYDRINKIKTTLEKEVNSNQFQSVRLSNKSKISNSNLKFYSNYKTYQIQGLDIQVQVPSYLFELNSVIIADQKILINDKSKYKYDGRKIEKINNQ